MADEPQVIRGIDWKATFPFVSLFRGFRVAIHPSKLILALAALVLIFFGGKLLDEGRPHRPLADHLGDRPGIVDMGVDVGAGEQPDQPFQFGLLVRYSLGRDVISSFICWLGLRLGNLGGACGKRLDGALEVLNLQVLEREHHSARE